MHDHSPAPAALRVAAPDHDPDHALHVEGQSHSHGAPEGIDLVLTLLTILGLAVASFSAFVMPLPPVAVTVALAVAYLAGGVPAGIQALGELFGKFRLDIDLLMVAAASVGAVLEGRCCWRFSRCRARWSIAPWARPAARSRP